MSTRSETSRSVFSQVSAAEVLASDEVGAASEGAARGIQEVTRPRLAILGAFPYPYPQGSQVYLTDQARALSAAADPVLLTYGRGRGELPSDLRVVRAPRRSSTRALRSGPQWGKPVADAGLLLTLVSAHRRHRFEAVLAHNAEAALVAMAARRVTGVPVIYVAHTVLRHELSAYGPPRWARVLDALGASVDRRIARSADAVIALCPEAARALRPEARGPVRVIPPGLEVREAPPLAFRERVCSELRLRPGRFVLYAGNLDGYQDLDLLAAAAEQLPESAGPVIVATHDAPESELDRPAWKRLRFVEIEPFEKIRALCFAAGVLVVTRRRPGGFPVKLLNYMETGRPIVAFEQVAAGLEHDREAWLLPADAGAPELARALHTLRESPRMGERLGRAARLHLEAHHTWPELAAETLDLVECVTRLA